MRPPERKVETPGFHVSWGEILADWDVIVADLYAVYGSAVDTVTGWLNLKRLILGLMGRQESVFASTRARKYQEELDQKKKQPSAG